MPGDFDDLIPQGGGTAVAAPPPAAPGAFDDLVPKGAAAPSAPAHNQFADLIPEQAEMRAAPAPGLLTKFRESLSPLIGPTEAQRSRESVPWGVDKDGHTIYQYRPAGGAAEQEGFFPALSKPMVPIPRARADANDSTIRAAAKAVYNTGTGFAEFLESPLGVATGGVGELAAIPKGTAAIGEAAEAARLAKNLGRGAGAGYVADMASKVPQGAANAGTLSVTGNTQQKIEADLGVASQIVLPAAISAGAFADLIPKGEAPAAAAAPAPPATVTEGPVRATDGSISEFGGEAREAPVPVASAETGPRPPGQPVAGTVSPSTGGEGREAPVPVASAETGPRPPDQPAAGTVSPSPGGEGRGEGELQTVSVPPWAQSSADYANQLYEQRRADVRAQGRDDSNVTISFGAAQEQHAALVKQAIADGLPVPDAVKAEYAPTETGRAPSPLAAEPAFERGDADESGARGNATFLPEEPGAGGMPVGERPPDLIDALKNDVGGKLSLQSAREVDPEFKPTGALRGLFTSSGGKALDLAAQGLGHVRSFSSADDFLSALQDAAGARKGWKEQTQTLDQKLQSLKYNTHGKLFEGVTSLPVHLWNASIDVVRLGVAGGKALKEAIEDGIGWLKQKYPDVPFDADHYRRAVNEQYGVRGFSEKLQADAGVSGDVKRAATDTIYQRRTNEDDAGAAARLVQTLGTEGAVKSLEDVNTPLPGGVRSALSNVLIRQLGDNERLARAKGDQGNADALADQQVRVIQARFARGTDIAQELQGFAAYGQATAAALLKHAQQLFDAAGDRTMQAIRPAVEYFRRGLERANAEALQGTIRDPDVNAAARAAVNHAVENHPEIQAAAQAEAAATGKPVDVAERIAKARKNMAKPDIHQQKLDLQTAGEFERGAPPLPKPPGDPLNLQTVAEAERGAPPLPKPPGDPLNLQTVAEAERGAPEMAKGPLNPKPATTPNELDARIRAALKAANIRLGDLVKQHGSVVDAAGRTIGERVVADSGLTGERADALRQAFNKRFGELATARKRALIEQMVKSGLRLPRQVGGAVDQLIKWSNVGAFDTQKFYEQLKTKLGLPTLTPELSREIVRRANDVQALPDGFQRERAGVQLLNHIAQHAPLRWYDRPMALWYANVLSGFTTPVHILMDNVDLLAGNTAVSLLRNPAAFPEAAAALARGLGRGAAQTAEILRSGITTGVADRVMASKTLEQNPFHGLLAPLNNWKYVGRVLSATHVLMFKPALELKQTLMARELARTEGLSGRELSQRIADVLGNTDTKVAAARAQALQEGLKGLDLRRRTTEILEQARNLSLPMAGPVAKEFALRSTYLNDPYGALGRVVNGINHAIAGIQDDHPKLGFVPRLMVPFTKIVGNIVNEKLNWSPVGAFRALRAMQSGELYGKPVTDSAAIGDLLTKSIAGTVGTAAITALAAQYLTDPDPKFAITGSGPGTPQQRQQLEAAGWHPHSLKIGGTYIDYLRTPLAIPLAVAGNYLDAIRYRKLDQTDALNRATFVLKGTGDVLVHQSYLDSISRLFDALGNENTKSGGEQMARELARGAGPFLVPNLAMQVDRLFDPKRYDDTGAASLVRAQIPFARRANQPAVNVLGEPIQQGVWQSDFGTAKPDALWKVLTEKQAWVPAPARDTIVGDRARGPDHYRTLTPDELYDYTVESGARIRASLERQTSRLQDMTPDRARKFVQQVTDEQRARTLRMFRP